MKKIGWILGLLCIFCLFFPGTVWAKGQLAVDDRAELLTGSQEQELSQQLEALSSRWNQDFVIVTTYDAEGKDAPSYADDYYDYNGYGENGVLYLIDLDNNQVYISTSGAMRRFLTDDRIDKILEDGTSYLKEKDYGEGLSQMLARTESFMKAGIPDSQYIYDVQTGEVSRYRTVTAGELLIALAAALACGGVFAGAVIASYKMKHSSYDYPFRNLGKVEYIRREDRFINQVVTSRQIPKSPPPGSGGGGGGGRSSVHTSSSGRSHGGGGRSL